MTIEELQEKTGVNLTRDTALAVSLMKNQKVSSNLCIEPRIGCIDKVTRMVSKQQSRAYPAMARSALQLTCLHVAYRS
jgi:hypothetical protein